MPLIEQRAVLPLAVGSASRAMVLPAVPGMAEFADLGLGGLDIGAWEAVMAPARTPPEVIFRLHAAVRAASADLALQDKLRTAGFVAEISASPAALADKIRLEVPVWRGLIAQSGAQLD
jgi:tripartite-type tricarboxylate transporter receptor subunit TctC